MKELVVISGKGGTGKTSITGAFASIVKNKILIDCDVDAADLFLILRPENVKKYEFYAGQKAIIDKTKCDSCDKCIEACTFHAILKDYSILDYKCEGCKVCSLICPQKAISMHDSHVGEWYISKTRAGTMVHAKLGIAEDNSGKLVATIRSKAKELAKEQNLDFIITDGPPGIGCPVISSISGASAVLIVTEPTPSGIHDLKRIYELARQFNVKAYVCINKFDINIKVSSDIETLCKENSINLVGNIPYSNDFNKAQIAEKTIIEYGNKDIDLIINNIWKIIKSDF